MRARIGEAELAAALSLTPRALHELEEDDAEVENAVSIPQALKLAELLVTDILSLLGEADKPAPLPVAQVRAALVAEFKRVPDSREAVEDEIDWDLGPLLEGLQQWESVYTIAFVRRLSAAMSLDWRAVLLGVDLGTR